MGQLRSNVRTAWGAMIVAAAMLTPAVAWAQDAPPGPTLSRSAPPWIGFALILLLLVLVVGVSLMPSKRGHQD